MARSLIGLDVGTAAVRAAEVRLGRGTPVLRRFGQVALPPGAVVGGEVVDASAVSTAIRRLWKDAGFSSKRVVTGVAGLRVVARTTELPRLSDEDLRTSLPFHVRELIPIPVDEAIIDHQVLEPVLGEEGDERLRVLVVAAHRDVLRSLLAAVEGAGLLVDRVDLIAFALIRALYVPGFADLDEGADEGAAEGIVDIGGGVTNVVVHEHGVPKFIRSLGTGGVELTEALVTDLDVGFEAAEALKRRVDDDEDAIHAQHVVRAALVPMLEEIRSSLDFWQAQAPEEQLRRILLTGGASRTEALDDRLEQLSGATVVPANAFSRVDVSGSGLDHDSELLAESVGAVAVGLALSAEPLVAGGRRINLLPVEIAERKRSRRQVAYTATGVAAFAVVLLGLYAMRSAQVGDAEREAVLAEERTQTLQAQLAELKDVEALESDLSQRRDRAVTALTGDIAWGRLIQEVATVLPNDVWLTAFNGSGDGVQFSAMGFDQTSTARWIQRISQLESLTSLWVPSSTKTPAGSERSLVTFSSSASLTPAAQSNRAERYQK